MIEAARTDDVNSQTEADSFKDLINRAQAGDQTAFSELYEEFRPRVAKFLFNSTGDYWLADELSNDTFLRAHGALPNLRRCRQSSLLSFLFRIAANLLRDHFRHKYLPTISMQDDGWCNLSAEAGADHQGADCLESNERRQMLRQAIDSLGPDQAALISLAHFDELTAEQIAGVLGKPSAQAVRAALHRAMQNLHKVLLRQGYFTPAAV